MTQQNEPMSGYPGTEISLSDNEQGAEAEFLPSLKPSEFEYPIGDEIPLPDTLSDPLKESMIVEERMIGKNNFIPVWFLERGATVQRAVARVVLTKPYTTNGHTFQPGTGWATGFMVSPGLFLTNNHVIHEKSFADKVRVQFNFQKEPAGKEATTESYYPDANDVFHTNPALDYTLVRLRPNQEEEEEPVEAGDKWGFIALNDSPVYGKDQPYNIVQHPKGLRKQLSLQDNELDKLFSNVVRYRADTEPGSSGSPVLNNRWELVALHHAGGDRDAQGTWLNNEGIRIDAVVKDLREHFSDIGRQDVLDELGI